MTIAESWPWLVLAVGLVIFLFVLRERRREHKLKLERETRSREIWERNERALEAKRLAEEKERKELEAATLFGQPGEPVDAAAERLGIQIRYKTESEWFGRHGDDAYRVKVAASPESAKPPQAVFLRMDKWERTSRCLGVDFEKFLIALGRCHAGDDYGGCKILEAGTDDLPYDQQLYDGDFCRYVKFVDQIGQIIWMNDRGSRCFLGWAR